MRKLLVGAALVVSVAMLAIAGQAGAGVNGNGAEVFSGFNCTLFDGTGAVVSTVNTHSVQNLDNTGGVTICQATVANPTGSSVSWNFANTGDTCGIVGTQTEDWSETISASGQATLRCHLNGSSR